MTSEATANPPTILQMLWLGCWVIEHLDFFEALSTAWCTVVLLVTPSMLCWSTGAEASGSRAAMWSLSQNPRGHTACTRRIGPHSHILLPPPCTSSRSCSLHFSSRYIFAVAIPVTSILILPSTTPSATLSWGCIHPVVAPPTFLPSASMSRQIFTILAQSISGREGCRWCDWDQLCVCKSQPVTRFLAATCHVPDVSAMKRDLLPGCHHHHMTA